MRKKFLASLAGLTVVLSAVVLFNFMSATSNATSLPRDCDSNSVINCGATSSDELRTRYRENKTGDLPAIYSHYGVSAGMINSMTDANMGEVHKDGSITLNGKVVATEAKSIGRQDVYKPSTKLVINGKTYFEHEPKSTFARESIRAYIFLDQDGKFIAAILTSCGNPFTAHPKPVPTYKCESLSATKITRDEYVFTAKASVANGAVVTGYTYDFGDGKTASSTQTNVSHTYATPGTYTAKLTVDVKANDKVYHVTAPSCQVKITVEAAPQPVYKCDVLNARVIKLEDRHYAFDLAYTVKNGATLKTVDYDFGDGQTKKDVSASDSKSVSHIYAKAGSYKTVATLHFNVGNEVKDVHCEAAISTAPEMCTLIPSLPKDDARCTPCDVPGKEQYPKDSVLCVTPPVVPPTTPPVTPTPPELPHTGPAETISGVLGLGAIIAAGYYWYASRRSLTSALLDQ